ncbi:prepilin-type N-terminal cleavage/methylation domain-containing protein [Cerasicoccus frondis]|uniref:prepilin-type N-terminal cleavage/methylation domain-containing protein n=1 Tax=Cerasicoccus frondis TaxID=490090 RepID=UPI0028525570|nr:prepilin-type N-terminal cleavage/methylation domain-containing protein [Cerasicoccus frondis]
MHMRPANPASAKAKRGFTLPEILIALLLITLLSAGLISFMLDVARGIFWGTEKAEISEDVRSFTMRLAAEARSSNAYIIYKSFAQEDRNEGSDRRDDGQSGDCLVLFTTEPYPDADSPEHYTSAIIYFRKGSDESDGVGPVYRLSWQANPSQYVNASDVPMETMLANIAADDTGDYPVVIELSRGVANGRLFTNYKNGKVAVVNGEILHGNQVKEVTNTYNLSISPRG